MRCESCESEVAEVKSVPRDNLSGAVAKGFGPWGDAPPSVEWPRYMRALWWRGSAEGAPEATLCASCDGLLAGFRDSGSAGADHEWLAGVREMVARLGLRTPDTIPVGTKEIAAVATRIAPELLHSDASTVFAKYKSEGEQLFLAAANILLIGQESGQTLMLRFHAADLLTKWDDPRATGYLVAALGNPGYALHVTSLIEKRGDLNALPAAVDGLVELLRVRHRYAPAGDAPYVDSLGKAGDVMAMHPGISPRDAVLVALGGVLFGQFLRLVVTLGGEDLGRAAAHEVYAHTSCVGDVFYVGRNVRLFARPEDADLIALTIAEQAYSSAIGSDFERALAYMVDGKPASGWWAMERFIRTAQHWKDRIPGVEASLENIPKPDDETLRKLERRYGAIVDATREKPKQGAGPKPVAATAAKSGCLLALIGVFVGWRHAM